MEQIRVRINNKPQLQADAEARGITLSQLVRERLKPSRTVSVDNQLYEHLTAISERSGLTISELVKAAVVLKSGEVS